MKRLSLLILAPLILISLVGGCTSDQDIEAETQEIANQWSQEVTENIASEIAEAVFYWDPRLQSAAAPIIEDLIENEIEWEYSDPTKIEDDRYYVIATAHTNFEAPLLGAYEVSVNFDLEIDTEKKEVLLYSLDTDSLVIREISE